MAKTLFYVLVNSSTEGLVLYHALHGRGLAVRIAPAPHGVVSCCGMSLAVDPDEMPAVRDALDADPTLRYDRVVEVANAIDPHRDAYC